MFKKSSILLASSLVSNVVGLLGYFLLVKVYPIDVIGEYFALFAASTILGTIIHFGFSQAIPLMDNRELRYAVTILSSISLSFIFIGGVFLVFGLREALFPLFAGVLSASSLSEIVFVRSGRVRYIAVFRVLLPLSSFSVCIIASLFFVKSYHSMAFSYLFGYSLIACYALRFSVIPNLSKVTMLDFYSLVRKYSKFMKYIGPGMIVHTVAYNMPSTVGLNYFGPTSIAAYNLAYKFVLAPMSIVGQAVGQSYVSRLSREYRTKTGLRQDYMLDVVLFIFSMTACLVIYFLFPVVARWLFPDNSQEIIRFSVALIPLAFSMLYVAPLSNLFQFTNNQKKIFFAHLLTLLCAGVAFTIAIYLGDFLFGVRLFSILVFIRYFWLYFEILKVRKRQC